MVFSELAAATLIAICGLKNSYRIVLKGERVVRRRIRMPAPALDGYQTFPRYLFRRIFRAGLVIAMRWEGRAKNAAQIAADTRLRAARASTAVAKRAENVRTAAQDRAHAVRERAEKAKQQAVAAKDSMVRLRDNVQQRIASASQKEPTSTASPSATSQSSPTQSHRKFSSIARINSLHQPSLADALPNRSLTATQRSIRTRI